MQGGIFYLHNAGFLQTLGANLLCKCMLKTKYKTYNNFSLAPLLNDIHLFEDGDCRPNIFLIFVAVLMGSNKSWQNL